jgi:nitrile hydratase
MEATTAPAYKISDRVRTKRRMPAGHTRLPRYARDVEGRVVAYHGVHALPDAGAKGRHEGDHLYTVSFAAQDLWGPEADSRDSVAMELWESYFVSP